MRHSRLVVVGIANTMDLPERLLPKVLSRLGLARVVFSPYTRDQIRTIIKVVFPVVSNLSIGVRKTLISVLLVAAC
jgi:hypothetical protein